MRSGNGPCFLELQTYRFRAHSMFDPDLYRDKAEIEALAAWVRSGAKWPEKLPAFELKRHWAFEPIVKPPATGNAIDFFIGERLKHVGLRPSPAAFFGS